MNSFNLKRTALFILFLIAFNNVFSQKSKAVKAIYKVAKKQVLTASSDVFLKNADNIVKRNLTDHLYKYPKELVSRKQIAERLTKEDLSKWVQRSGFSEKNVGGIIKKIGDKNLKQLWGLLKKDTPLELRKTMISDIEKKPEFIDNLIENGLLESYIRISGMGRRYRTNIVLLKQVKQGVNPIKISTINEKYEGKFLEGVKFVRKTLEIDGSGGIKISGVFPDFKKFSIGRVIQLPNYLVKVLDAKQYNYAFLKFQNQLKRNKELQQKFSPEVLQELLQRKIKSAKAKGTGMVPGYTWHHREDGAMVLVDHIIHKKVSHTGLQAINGGGTILR